MTTEVVTANSLGGNGGVSFDGSESGAAQPQAIVNTTVGPFGGLGGDPFQDPASGQITKITIGAGSVVDSIQTTYAMPGGTSKSLKHGGDGGVPTDIDFNAGEHIIAIIGRAGRVLDSIAILTEDQSGVRRTFGPFGGGGGDQFIIHGKVDGFFGRSGGVIDQIGFFVS
jgi:hypothetical protein